MRLPLWFHRLCYMHVISKMWHSRHSGHRWSSRSTQLSFWLHNYYICMALNILRQQVPVCIATNVYSMCHQEYIMSCILHSCTMFVGWCYVSYSSGAQQNHNELLLGYELWTWIILGLIISFATGYIIVQSCRKYCSLCTGKSAANTV